MNETSEPARITKRPLDRPVPRGSIKSNPKATARSQTGNRDRQAETPRARAARVEVQGRASALRGIGLVRVPR